MISHEYKTERKAVAAFMRRLYERDLTTTSGGNISVRISNEIIAITPSATDKGRMKWKEVGLMTMEGVNITAGLKPSIESFMHLSIYKKKNDIKAIVHAHPVFATSFTAMKTTINTCLTAEARAICGEPVFVPYALMGTSELAELAAQNIEKGSILLLENHGILAAGRNLIEAFDRIEVLENAARMTLIVAFAGNKSELDNSRINQIDKLFR
jgi:L-fuculose-phosphate aldolase